MKRRISQGTLSVRSVNPKFRPNRNPADAESGPIKEHISPSLKPVSRNASRKPARDENTNPAIHATRPTVQSRPSHSITHGVGDARVLGEVGNCPARGPSGERTRSYAIPSPQYRRAESESEQGKSAACTTWPGATSVEHDTGIVAHPQRSIALEAPPHEVREVSKPACPGTRATTTLVQGVRKVDKAAWQALFIHAARLNARNSRGDTALTFAIHANRPRLVSLLLDAGLDLDLDQKARDGRTPITLAFELGRVGIARQLLEWKAQVAGMQALPLTFCAAAWGRLDFVQHLLANGADVEATDPVGATLLIAAAAKNHLDLVALLMRYGANAQATTNEGVNAAVAAAANGHLAALRYFIEDLRLPLDSGATNGMSALQKAAKRGHVRVVKYLVDQGADIHALAPNGQDIVMLAAANGRLAVLRYLIERLGIPASPATDQEGLTALHLAASQGHLHVVQYFFAHSTIAGLKTDDGEDVATIAARNGHLKVLEFLKGRAPESDAGFGAMRPADFMALVQSLPGPRQSTLDAANRPAPPTREQRLFDAMLVEIEAQRPVTAGRFNAYLARARDGLWPTADGLTRFMKGLEVLLLCLRALPAHNPGRGRNKALTETACAMLAIAEFDRYAIFLMRHRNRPESEWSGSSDFRGHLGNHVKTLSTTRAFLWILDAANRGDRLGLKPILRAETRGERRKLHRSADYKKLIAEYRQAHRVELAVASPADVPTQPVVDADGLARWQS